MIIKGKGDSALNQDNQDIQPPPPEYTEALVRPEQTHVQPPAPAAQPQYPPQPSPYNQGSLAPQQRQAQIGQEYRDRCESPSSRLSEPAKFPKFTCSTGPMREWRTRCNHDIRNMRYHLCCHIVSDRFGVSVVSLYHPVLSFTVRSTQNPSSQQRR